MSDFNDLSGKVTLDTTDYKTSVSELNRQIRVIESEFRATAAAMGQWDKSADGLAIRNKALASQIDLQKAKVSALTGEYEKIVTEKGKDSRAAQELEIKLNKQKETLGKMTTELQQSETALAEMGNESKVTGGKVDDLGDKTEKTANKANNFKATLGGVGTVIKGVSVAAAALGTAVIGIGAAMGKLVLSSASAADSLVETSAKTGLTVQQLQELSYVGKQTGTDLETITGANAKMIRSMSSAKSGTGDAAAAFHKLGISVRDSATGELRNSQEVFQEALSALNGISNETERDALAMSIFGKSAQELNPLIKTSREELNRLTQEASSVGAVMSDEAVQGLAGFNDTLDSLKSGLQGTLGELAFSFLPGFQGMADTAGGYLKTFSGIVKGSNGDVGEMARWTGGLIGKIVNDIAGKAPELLKAGLGIVQGIMDAVIGNLPVMLPAAMEMIKSLVGFIIQCLPVLVDAAVQILLMLVNSVITMLPMLLTAAVQIIVQLANGIAQALPQLIPAVIGILLQLVMTLIQNLPMLITAAINLVIALVQGILAALPLLQASVPQLITTIVDTLITSLPQLLVAAVQIIAMLVTGILQQIPVLIGTVPTLINTLVEKFKSPEFKSQLQSAGEAIVQGFMDGFNGYWETFKSNIVNNFQNMVSEVKQLLGIASPSKVFYQMGGYSAEGYGLGWSSRFAKLKEDLNRSMSLLVNQSGLVNLNGSFAGAAGGSFSQKSESYQFFAPVILQGASGSSLGETIKAKRY